MIWLCSQVTPAFETLRPQTAGRGRARNGRRGKSCAAPFGGMKKRAGDDGINPKHSAHSLVSEPLFRFRVGSALLYQRGSIASDRCVWGTARRGRTVNVATSRAQCASRRGAARGGQWQRGTHWRLSLRFGSRAQMRECYFAFQRMCAQPGLRNTRSC